MPVSKERILEVLNSQKGRTITILSSLIYIQNAFGYLPPESFALVADFTSSTPNDVYSVATFYTHFRFTPPGKHNVEVCVGPACHVVGGSAVMAQFKESLGVNGKADPDASVRANFCLGACAQGPVALVDEKLHGRLTPELAKQVVAGLETQAGPH